MWLDSSWCLLPSSPERTDISKSVDRPLEALITLSCPYQASHGTTTYTCHGPRGFYLSQTVEFSPCSYAVNVHTAGPIFCCPSLLPGPSACTLELHCRWHCLWASIEVWICLPLLLWSAHCKQWLVVPVCHRYSFSCGSRGSCASLKMEVASCAHTAVLDFQGQKMQLCTSTPCHLLRLTEHIV